MRKRPWPSRGEAGLPDDQTLRSVTDYEQKLRRVTIGDPQRVDGPIHLAEYEPAWPQAFEREAARIRQTLGGRALLVEHAGSTSVPGLAAKPRIDVVLAVPDSADEPAYVPAMEAAAYTLRIREPDWHEHRVFESATARGNPVDGTRLSQLWGSSGRNPATIGRIRGAGARGVICAPPCAGSFSPLAAAQHG